MPKAPRLSTKTAGLVPIVPTPFNDDGSLALGDVPRLVDFYEQCGVVALTVLGKNGEPEKLSDEETSLVTREFVRYAKDRLPVIIGISGGFAKTVERAKAVMDAGAQAVMIRPMNGLKADDAIIQFFERYTERTQGKVPICVQDDPKTNNITLSVDAWCQVSKLEPVIMLKLEPTPTLPKLSRIVDAQNVGDARKVSILPSFNGMHLPQLLARGASGAMAGFAFIDALVEVYDLYTSGEIERAEKLHDAMMPIMRYKREFPLVLRKEILRRRGILTSNHVRYPGTRIEARDLAEFDLILKRLNRSFSDLGFAPVGDTRLLSVA